MIVGFTGSGEGMSDNQAVELWHWLGLIRVEYYPNIEFHHGDCVGADADAEDLARIRGYKTISHPPTNESKRAFKKSDLILEAKSYMARNTDIAKACDILLAAPKEGVEVLRSGTWSTIRRARKLNKEVIILPPRKIK